MDSAVGKPKITMVQIFSAAYALGREVQSLYIMSTVWLLCKGTECGHEAQVHSQSGRGPKACVQGWHGAVAKNGEENISLPDAVH